MYGKNKWIPLTTFSGGSEGGKNNIWSVSWFLLADSSWDIPRPRLRSPSWHVLDWRHHLVSYHVWWPWCHIDPVLCSEYPLNRLRSTIPDREFLERRHWGLMTVLPYQKIFVLSSEASVDEWSLRWYPPLFGRSIALLPWPLIGSSDSRWPLNSGNDSERIILTRDQHSLPTALEASISNNRPAASNISTVWEGMRLFRNTAPVICLCIAKTSGNLGTFEAKETPRYLNALATRKYAVVGWDFHERKKAQSTKFCLLSFLWLIDCRSSICLPIRKVSGNGRANILEFRRTTLAL